MNDSSPLLPSQYVPFLEDLKARIRSAQIKAAAAVNSELVALYWQIGQQILSAQQTQGWGAGIIPSLSKDLTAAFPGMKGFSERNLKYMRAMAETWSEEQIVQEPLAQLTWYHNLALLEKLDDSATRLWYAQRTVENGWSRNVLVAQIESRLHAREGRAVTNFQRTIPAPLSDLAQQIIKDPYCFEFLDLKEKAEERELEEALITHIRRFLLELGAGFAFVGSQYHLEVGGEDFYIDLLFYHLKLRCYVVIELKTGKFKPEYTGKLNFYLAVVDDLLRHKDDAPTIGLILCKDKKGVVAEYSLRGMNSPMGVAEFEIPGSLPSIESIERELGSLPDEG